METLTPDTTADTHELLDTHLAAHTDEGAAIRQRLLDAVVQAELDNRRMCAEHEALKARAAVLGHRAANQPSGGAFGGMPVERWLEHQHLGAYMGRWRAANPLTPS